MKCLVCQFNDIDDVVNAVNRVSHFQDEMHFSVSDDIHNWNSSINETMILGLLKVLKAKKQPLTYPISNTKKLHL